MTDVIIPEEHQVTVFAPTNQAFATISSVPVSVSDVRAPQLPHSRKLVYCTDGCRP